MYSKRKKRANARTSESDAPTSSAHDDRPLIDRFGKKHSARVLTMRSPAVLKAMGIQPVDGSGESKTA